MPISDVELLKLIKENGYLAEKDLKKAVSKVKLEKISLYESLLQLDLISDENIGKLLSDYLKLPFVVLSKTQIDQDVLNVIPESLASNKRILSYGLDENGLKIATSNPDNSELFKLISQKVNMPLVIYY